MPNVQSTMRPILAAIAAEGQAGVEKSGTPQGVRPFVTISRQAGAGGWALAGSLANMLNKRDRGPTPWQVFDRLLVETVAKDHNISTRLIDSIEDVSHNWLKDILGALTVDPAEITVYRRLAQTMRAIAQVGHAIVVGRGGFFVTHGVPGGIHVRLVAPREYRVENSMRQFELSQVDAERRVDEITRNREEFFRRYCKSEADVEDMFTVTFNTSQMSEQRIAEMLMPLIPAVDS